MLGVWERVERVERTEETEFERERERGPVTPFAVVRGSSARAREDEEEEGKGDWCDGYSIGKMGSDVPSWA